MPGSLTIGRFAAPARDKGALRMTRRTRPCTLKDDINCTCSLSVLHLFGSFIVPGQNGTMGIVGIVVPLSVS